MDKNAVRLFPLTCPHALLSEQQMAALSIELTGVTKHRTQPSATAPLPAARVLPITPQSQRSPHHRIDAGYTYLGQFIAHDIVPKSNPREQCRPLSPWLNLDSLYGHGAEGELFDDNLFDPQGRFIINDNQFDARRCENGVAVIAEPRNDENAVIVQLHVLWQQVHNYILAHHTSSGSKRHKLLQARSQTLALFHLIVIDDFLRRLLEPSVYQYYFQDWQAGIQPLEQALTAIPVEFSHAGFRFGHSMTLGFYDLNSQPDNLFSLADLLRSPSSPPLEPRHRIQWSKFFGSNALEAKKFSMLISMDMTHIPIEGNIIHINLLAGQTQQLPTAKQIADWLTTQHAPLATALNLADYPKLSADSDKRLGAAYHTLNRNFANESLPLWLYILGESALNPPPNTKAKLGKIGSIINAEVLRSSILSCSPQKITQAGDILHSLQQSAGEIYQHIRHNSADGCCTMSNLINWINKENNNEH